MAKSKLVKANKKIEEKVVGGYKKMEDGVVGTFNKIADKFVDNFLTEEGESVEQAKERLAAEQKEREAVKIAESKKWLETQSTIVEKSMQDAKNAAVSARRMAGINYI